jgi:transcriptional regulator GlxA family with amidase domain
MKTLKLIPLTLLTVFLFRSASAQMQYAKNAINVAVLVFDGVEILDFCGPSEVFADATNDDGMLCHVYTVGVTGEEIAAQGFMKITPNYSIANCPKPDLIVIPGGNSTVVSKNEKVINWLKSCDKTNTMYMSVCTGALVPSKTGMLDGKTATTHYCCQDALASNKNIKVVKDTRFVDNGMIITTEGISAGIDGSLYVLEKKYGHQVAKDVADYMMYDWRPNEFKTVVN